MSYFLQLHGSVLCKILINLSPLEVLALDCTSKALHARFDEDNYFVWHYLLGVFQERFHGNFARSGGNNNNNNSKLLRRRSQRLESSSYYSARKLFIRLLEQSAGNCVSFMGEMRELKSPTPAKFKKLLDFYSPIWVFSHNSKECLIFELIKGVKSHVDIRVKNQTFTLFAIRLLVDEYYADLFSNPRVLCVACLRGYDLIVEYMLSKLKNKPTNILAYRSEEKVYLTRNLIIKEKLPALEWVRKVCAHGELLPKPYKDNLKRIERLLVEFSETNNNNNNSFGLYV